MLAQVRHGLPVPVLLDPSPLTQRRQVQREAAGSNVAGSSGFDSNSHPIWIIHSASETGPLTRDKQAATVV
ncbi:MAG: hypothetical protein ABIQ87_00945 [Rubrivivax sp.]